VRVGRSDTGDDNDETGNSGVVVAMNLTQHTIDNLSVFFCPPLGGSAGRSYKHRVQTNGTKNSNVVRQQCTIFNWVNDSTLRESFERCE
jgi:hypothetical protein